MSTNILPDKTNTSVNTKHLKSEIINQKKQFIFKVEQTSDFVYPNEGYKYYIYLKNISGVDINNIHVIVNNPDVVVLDQEGEDLIEIGTMKNGEVKLIYLKAKCVETGLYYTHFICYGDGTGLFNKTLKINCSYNNASNDVIHRIHIYDFSPYEDTYRMDVGDFSNQVTQLFKKQKLPYKAGEQPFSIKIKNTEASIEPFNNVEYLSFEEQFKEAQYDKVLDYNNDEHHYSYIGRENFNANSIESFEGKNLNDIINNINENSQYFKATFLKTGTNELLNDFKEYSPNGFIYRFGLLNSEIYHNIGVLPTYSYMSDFLFRWAPSLIEPPNLIPQKRAMVWNEKKWAGHGWNVYRIATVDYIASPDWEIDFNAGRVSRWEILETFRDLDSAESYIERLEYNDDIIEAQLSLDYERFYYEIRETFYDVGVFYVNIPLNQIPTNFYLLNTEDIEAIIQRSKPFGVKPLIRYVIEKQFNEEMEFLYHPIIKPYTEFYMGDMSDITFFIQSKKYKKVTESICGQDISKIKLMPFGRTINYGLPFEESILFNREDVLPRVVYTNPINETGKPISSLIKISSDKNRVQKNNEINLKIHLEDEDGNPVKGEEVSACIGMGSSTKYNLYKLEPNTATTPDNNFNMDMENENEVTPTVIDNSINTLFDISDILYQNNADNIGFFLQSIIYQQPKLKDDTIISNNFISEWAKNQNYIVGSYKVEQYSTEYKSGYKILDERQSQQYKKYNTFKVPIIFKNQFTQGDKEIGIGLLDDLNKYHCFSTKFDKENKQFYIKYSTSFNNQYSDKKDGVVEDITGLVFTTIKIGFKHLVVFFVEDVLKNLHYFHHTIISDISDIFLFISDNFTAKDKNDKIIKKEINIKDYFKCVFLNDREITLELPYVHEFDKYESEIIDGGYNWTNLYRIDRAENSYTYIHNKTNQIIDVDNIMLHYDNLNIPDNAIIKSMKLKTLINSSASSEIYCSCATQGNIGFDDALGNSISLKPSFVEAYPQKNNSQFIYGLELDTAQENENEKLAEQYKNLLIENILFNDSANIEVKDFLTNQDDFINIKHCYWLEFSDFTYERFNSNNIEKIEFVIEGYNSSKEVNMISQLMHHKSATEKISIKIESGYFYKKIKMPFLTDFGMDNIRLRYKFNDLIDDLKIFNTYVNITFKNKEEKTLDFLDTDSAVFKNKKIINFDCLLENITPEEINNGFTVKLDFDSLSPGDFYRIYFAELDIIYEHVDSTILINKNKFNYISHDEAYTTVSGENTSPYLSGLFYNDVASVIQAESNINIDNHGLELKEKLYQSFIANTDNITSIEIYPNGFIGNPDDTLKIGLYTNHANTPYKLIKEVYASGWTKSNQELKDLYSIKYNFNIDGLTINEKYWIKIEVENPNPNSYYLLNYTTSKKDNFTLLLDENNNYINTFGALEFNIYSKNLTRSFAQLPTVQDYFNNPYILIGIHKSGNLKKLRVKKKGVTNEEESSS